MYGVRVPAYFSHLCTILYSYCLLHKIEIEIEIEMTVYLTDNRHTGDSEMHTTQRRTYRRHQPATPVQVQVQVHMVAIPQSSNNDYGEKIDNQNLDPRFTEQGLRNVIGQSGLITDSYGRTSILYSFS